RSHARGGGCLQRTVQPRTALMAEPVSAFGEVAGEGARGQQGATRVRRGPHPVRARAGVRRSGCAEGGAARAVAKTAGPVSTEPQRRVQAATHLLPGESPPESESGAGNGARANARPAGQRPWQNRCAGESRTPGGIPAFPPSRQQTSGYISDVSTTPPTVTFLNGSTGPFTFPPVNPPRRDPVAPGTESVPGAWAPIPSPFLTTSPTRRLPQARRLCLGLGFLFLCAPPRTLRLCVIFVLALESSILDCGGSPPLLQLRPPHKTAIPLVPLSPSPPQPPSSPVPRDTLFLLG